MFLSQRGRSSRGSKFLPLRQGGRRNLWNTLYMCSSRGLAPEKRRGWRRAGGKEKEPKDSTASREDWLNSRGRITQETGIKYLKYLGASGWRARGGREPWDRARGGGTRGARPNVMIIDRSRGVGSWEAGETKGVDIIDPNMQQLAIYFRCKIHDVTQVGALHMGILLTATLSPPRRAPRIRGLGSAGGKTIPSLHNTPRRQMMIFSLVLNVNICCCWYTCICRLLLSSSR